MGSQQNAEEKQNTEASTPDLILEGSGEIVPYALDWSKQDPVVASGGKDKVICLWNVSAYFDASGRIAEKKEDAEKGGMLSRMHKNLADYLTLPSQQS